MTSIPIETPNHPFWFRHPLLLQRITAIVICLATITGVVVGLLQGSTTLVVVPPLVAFGGFILVRWRAVVAVLVVAAAPLLAALLEVNPLVTWTIGVFAALLFTLRGVPAAFAGPVIGLAAYISVFIYLDSFLDAEGIVALSTAVAAAAIGSAIRGQVRYVSAMDQRAKDIIATRDSEVSRSVAEERLRIARDLHDVVGHEVAVLSMQLGVVEVALPVDADQSRAALLSARAGVKSILFETQRILDVLRIGEGDELAPAPTLQAIPALVESYRSIGLDVSFTMDQLPEVIDPAVSAAAFRITQEALTNAQRHGAGPVTLAVESTADSLTVQAFNAVAMTTTASQGSGYGLVGMRERATSVSGTLAIDQSQDRFRVVAQLPLRKAPK